MTEIKDSDSNDEIIEIIKDKANISPERIDGSEILGGNESNLFFRVDSNEEERVKKSLEDLDFEYETSFLIDDSKESWGKTTFEIKT